jgi:hypothetical protein
MFHQPKVTTYLLVYVDDTIPVSSSALAASHLVAAPRSEFVLKDLGPLHYFLGIVVSSLQKGLVLTQKKYALDLLHQPGIVVCYSVILFLHC